LGIPVVYLDLETPEQYQRDIATLGTIFGAPARAQIVWAYYETKMARVARALADLTEDEKLSLLLLQYNTRGAEIALEAPPPGYIQTQMAGIAVSALFSAGVGLLKYIADPLMQLPELVFWLLGALWSVDWIDTLSIMPISVLALIVTYFMRWRLNLLALDNATAVSLGSAPARERALLLGLVVAATAAIVSIAGIVNWVGLIVPQLARRIFGADAQRSLPGAILLGGIFAVICDDIARVAFVGELPLGIITSLLGALMFVVLMVAPWRIGSRRLETPTSGG
jgi:ABC-type Fe3+-siderophore transport system permease subunit